MRSASNANANANAGRSVSISMGCGGLAVAVGAGTVANDRPLLVTPISLLDAGPASWAYELILVVMALLAGLCLLRWGRSLRHQRLLGGALGLSGVLFLSLIALPFPASPWHDPVALTAMALTALHAIAAARAFRHWLLGLAAVPAALGLLLVCTARLPLVGLGEHLLLLGAMPGMLVCYGAPEPPPEHPGAPARERQEALSFTGLFEARAVLSACLWMGLVVTAARLVNSIELGVKAVAALALPCWLAGIAAAHCAASFPDAFLMRTAGLGAGLAVAWATGGLRSHLAAAVLLALGLPFLAGAHWIRQEVEDFGRGRFRA